MISYWPGSATFWYLHIWPLNTGSGFTWTRTPQIVAFKLTNFIFIVQCKPLFTNDHFPNDYLEYSFKGATCNSYWHMLQMMESRGIVFLPLYTLVVYTESAIPFSQKCRSNVFQPGTLFSYHIHIKCCESNQYLTASSATICKIQPVIVTTSQIIAVLLHVHN